VQVLQARFGSDLGIASAQIRDSVFESDWLSDTGGAPVIDCHQFQDCIFRVANNWAESHHGPNDYVDFLVETGLEVFPPHQWTSKSQHGPRQPVRRVLPPQQHRPLCKRRPLCQKVVRGLVMKRAGAAAVTVASEPAPKPTFVGYHPAKPKCAVRPHGRPPSAQSIGPSCSTLSIAIAQPRASPRQRAAGSPLPPPPALHGGRYLDGVTRPKRPFKYHTCSKAEGEGFMGFPVIAGGAKQAGACSISSWDMNVGHVVTDVDQTYNNPHVLSSRDSAGQPAVSPRFDWKLDTVALADELRKPVLPSCDEHVADPSITGHNLRRLKPRQPIQLLNRFFEVMKTRQRSNQPVPANTSTHPKGQTSSSWTRGPARPEPFSPLNAT
jgi:hypothetical protein